jgi:pyruvate,orthophosphate dikinase
MIEVPRGALAAAEIAKEAEFFSFGTNDLTQTTFGISRDDVGSVLISYLEKDIYPADPFVTLDRDGVGELMRIAVARGRATRPGIKLGICGEHGGDPASVEFCHEIGLDYVSASPYRLPIARLAAAQAVLKERAAKGRATATKSRRGARATRAVVRRRGGASKPAGAAGKGARATRKAARGRR